MGMRHSKMAEWMENVEKAIARIMANKVYTSAEFKRERDTFSSLCKDLERTEVKKWLASILEILMAERAKDQKKTENDKLDALIQKHEELIPNVQKTSVMVDLYWKCYAYGDELKPHVEFLDGIMLSSTREIAPSCVENVDELIERQEKSLQQLDSKRSVVTDLIDKGKVILQNPDKPKFLQANVKRIEEGWDDTKTKARERLQLLNETKDAFIGYAENNETIASEFEVAEEEIKKVKKMFNLEAANADLKKRQDLLKKSTDTINGLFDSINANMATMSITIPEDKKKTLTKEIAAVKDKLEVNGRFASTVKKIEDLVADLTAFDNSLKAIDSWKDAATAELTDIKEFTPWLVGAEKAAGEGLSKPSGLAEVKALNDKVLAFDKNCVNYLKVLTSAQGAAQKMTTHAEADAEVAGLKTRFDAVKVVSDTWVKKCDVLVKEWVLLDNTVTELNSWVAKDKSAEGENQFSLEKMESTLGELKNIFKQKEKLVEGL